MYSEMLKHTVRSYKAWVGEISYDSDIMKTK